MSTSLGNQPPDSDMSPLSRWLLVLVAVFSLLWITTRPPPHRPLPQPPLVDDHSLTVILPVVQSTLASLDRLLAPFLASSAILSEVAIVCPRALVSDTHRKLHTVLWNATHGHPKVSLYPWSGHMHHHQASLDVITRVKTQWILLLDEHGFEQVAECDRAYLLHPRAVHLPAGPRGFSGSSHNRSQLEPSDRVQPAAFLVPPFVAPSVLLAGAPFTSHPSLVWPALGTHVARSTLGSFGGIILVACNDTTFPDEKLHDDSDSRTPADPGSLPPKGFFVLVFPRKQDLRNFIPATCKLHLQGYTVFAYLYDTFDEAGFAGVVIERNCTVPYFPRSKEIPGLSDWLDSLGSVPDVVIGLDHQDLVSSTLSSVLEQTPFLNTTLIRLPRRELPYTEWIGTLTLHELRRSSSLSKDSSYTTLETQIGTPPKLYSVLSQIIDLTRSSVCSNRSNVHYSTATRSIYVSIWTKLLTRKLCISCKILNGPTVTFFSTIESFTAAYSPLSSSRGIHTATTPMVCYSRTTLNCHLSLMHGSK